MTERRCPLVRTTERETGGADNCVPYCEWWDNEYQHCAIIKIARSLSTEILERMITRLLNRSHVDEIETH